LFGVWCLGFGVWCLVFGVWCLAFGVWRLLFGIKFLCETSLTFFSAVKKKPTPIPLSRVCCLSFIVWYQIPLRNFLNLFLSGVQKKAHSNEGAGF